MTVSELYKKADEASPGARGLVMLFGAAALIASLATALRVLIG